MFTKTKIAIAILTVLMAIGICTSSATAYVTSVVTVTETTHNEDHASTGTFIRFKILSYIKAQGLTKEEVRNAEECKMIGEGTDVPVYTNSGYSTGGGLFKFEDHDREKACKIDGQWRLVRCGNFVWFTILPHIFHGHVLLVRTFAHKKIHIRIPLHVVVPSPCGGPPAESSAFIKQWVKYRAAVKAKGDVRIRISGKIIDRVKAHVRAGATCEHTTTTITEQVPPPPPPPPCGNCGTPPCTTCEEPKQPPIVTNIETINDMLASRDGQHFQRTICFEAFPAPGSSLSDLEVVLRAENGEVFGSEAEYRGGNKFCQSYESPSETGTETYWGWARDKKTGLTAESEHKTFLVKSPPTF